MRGGKWRLIPAESKWPRGAAKAAGGQAMTNRWLEEQGIPNVRVLWIKVAFAPLAPAGRLTTGGLGRPRLTTGQTPESDWNRRMRTRMSGGVGSVTD